MPSYDNLLRNLGPLTEVNPLREAYPLTKARHVEPTKSGDIYANAVKLAAKLRREKLALEKENERIKVSNFYEL